MKKFEKRRLNRKAQKRPRIARSPDPVAGIGSLANSFLNAFCMALITNVISKAVVTEKEPDQVITQDAEFEIVEPKQLPPPKK